MKNAFTLLLLVLATTLIINAQIPGGSFETWQTATMEYPDSADWTVYDEESSPEKVGLLEKSGDASDGNYAIKFNMFGTYDFGYVAYGEIGDEGPTGGIPFADDPTQLTISYKCNMATDDSARLYVFLSSSGTIITNDTFKVTGVQSSYKDTTFTLSSYTETPDSLFFGLVPCDPDNQKIRADGLEIYFDNVRFSGGTNDLQIPDNSFEVWADTTLDYTAEMNYIRALSEKSDELVQEGDDFTYEVDTVTETGSLYVTFQATTGEKEVLPPKDEISIYPNPASDILYIKGTQRESLVEFVAITGAVIYQQRISGNTSLDITHIPAGLYFVKINNKVECKLYKH